MSGSPHRATRSTSRALLALPAALLLVLPGCGGDTADTGSDTATENSGSSFPVTVTGDDGELTLKEEPRAIVSLSATATEMLFAVGAGPQVVAVDAYSNHPDDAPVTDLSAFTPSAEAIAGYGPDLVVLSDDVNGVVDALDRLEIPTLLMSWTDSLDESYEQMETLGAATGHAEEADEVVTEVQDRIDAAVRSAADSAAGLSVYHEIDPSHYALTSDTFVGEIYTRFGMDNIADEAGTPGETTQLSAEYILGAAPELIVLADTVCCQQTAEALAQRPGWDTVPAVREGRVVEMNDDIASRWGPRMADFAETIAATLEG